MLPTAIVVRVDLSPAQWKAEVGGKGRWNCSALRLPGARFSALLNPAGEEVDSTWYSRRGHAIIWKGGSNPPPLSVELRFASVLVGRLRRLFALALAGAVGAALAQYLNLGAALELTQQAVALLGRGLMAG